MELGQRIHAFLELKKIIQDFLNKQLDSEMGARFSQILEKVEIVNPWFTEFFQLESLKGVSMLIPDNLEELIVTTYGNFADKKKLDIGVVSAGNIPLAGFHDFMCVILSGHRYNGKLSGSDNILLPFLIELLISIEPGLKDRVSLHDGLMKNMDAYIASGSDNSSRYFEYYFGKYPSIIRKNRNAIAVLKGNESKSDIEMLLKDVFYYFGKGCRSVSKLMLPVPYDFKMLVECFEDQSEWLEHTKYYNNYIYQKTILALAQQPFIDAHSALFVEQQELSTPIGVIAYEYYQNEKQLQSVLERDTEKIQCVVELDKQTLGTAQFPSFSDYADGVDTMKFLSSIN